MKNVKLLVAAAALSLVTLPAFAGCPVKHQKCYTCVTDTCYKNNPCGCECKVDRFGCATGYYGQQWPSAFNPNNNKG